MRAGLTVIAGVASPGSAPPPRSPRPTIQPAPSRGWPPRDGRPGRTRPWFGAECGGRAKPRTWIEGLALAACSLGARAAPFGCAQRMRFAENGLLRPDRVSSWHPQTRAHPRKHCRSHAGRGRRCGEASEPLAGSHTGRPMLSHLQRASLRRRENPRGGSWMGLTPFATEPVTS